ncbi:MULTISPECIES: response regulator transcription factor [Gracilibacillus]|uniref:response regulator transcription factor n=1 Tax=Gracilibacillus TaxID=74385 RepID=UPI000826A341|nr:MULTISPECIES: response regulator transcription factor [Gracilibacillus]
MKSGKDVLLIEDDQEISKLLQVILTKAGIATVAAYSGTEGLLQLQRQSFDLILLDLMLPGISGEELITQVREESAIPIIVISAKIGIEDKVQVLQMGADDYITKPFHQKEVEARVEVQLRKSATQPEQKAEKKWRGLSIDLHKYAATLEEQPLQLTQAELDILCLLIDHPDRAFSKQEIYEKIWKGTYVGDDNTISVHISNLRKKIADITPDEYIKTIWGVGFMLV